MKPSPSSGFRGGQKTHRRLRHWSQWAPPTWLTTALSNTRTETICNQRHQFSRRHSACKRLQTMAMDVQFGAYIQRRTPTWRYQFTASNGWGLSKNWKDQITQYHGTSVLFSPKANRSLNSQSALLIPEWTSDGVDWLEPQ